MAKHSFAIVICFLAGYLAEAGLDLLAQNNNNIKAQMFVILRKIFQYCYFDLSSRLHFHLRTRVSPGRYLVMVKILLIQKVIN